jgi:hypothetical protein
MGFAPGIAGSPRPELERSPEGYRYLPRTIPREQLRLVRQDIPPVQRFD